MNLDPRAARSSNRSADPSSPGLWWAIRQAAERAFGRRGSRGAARLAHEAGRARADGPSVIEPLEARQLLAIVTIPPSSIDPATGLGTVSGWFDYALPYLFKEIPDADQGQAMPVVEEFADEMDFWTQFNPAVPPNGTYFEGSAIRITYRTQAVAAVQLLPGATGPGDPAMDRDMRLSLQNTDQVSYEFWSGEPMGSGQNPKLRVTTNANINLGAGLDGDAIKTGANGTRLELLKRGMVVQTISGGALAQLITNNTLQIRFDAGFDTIRFSAADQNNTAAWSDSFVVDDITTTFPSTRFADFIDLFGATFTFTGPAGASVQILDLYGREMVINTFMGVDQMSGDPAPFIDCNIDGVPDMNDGIGRLIFRNVNARTSFTMVGADPSDLDDMGNAQQGAVPMELAGLFNEFEQAGFGFALTDAMPPAATGLPEGTGSVLIGSPIVRNNSSATAYISNGNQTGQALNQITQANFNRADQGIFVLGNTIGSVLIHGAVFGNSQFEGSIRSLNIGTQYGSININGDAGSIMIASDAGVWQADDTTGLDPEARFTDVTGGQIIVGRTVGELAIGGRMAMATQVLADINNTSRPPLSFIDYVEREVVYGIRPDTSPMEPVIYNLTLGRNASFRTRTGGNTGQGVFFGNSLYRNDNLQNAEYIGYNGTAVRIRGNLGAQDTVNDEDFTDVFAFAADPTREIVVQGSGLGLAGIGYARIVDRNGLTVAAYDLGAAGRGPGGNAGLGTVIRFRPDHADVYYLVLNTPINAGFGVDVNYDITVAGIAPTTIGGVLVGAGVGDRRTNAIGGASADQFLFTLNAGSMGLLRVGMGVTGGDGDLASPNDFINSNQSDDDLLDFGASSITVPVNLYGIVAGSDVTGASITVGRDLGAFVTGTSPVAGISNVEGDLTVADIRVGGRAGIFDIRGAVAANQDPSPDAVVGEVSIRTGTRGGRGDIGQILVGSYILGDRFSVTTSPGSIIDQFIILDNSASELFGPYNIRAGIPRFSTGVGSDIRFADFGLIQRPGDENLRIVLNYGQIYNFVDDAGASYTVQISGGTPADAAGSFLEAFTLSPDGSQGVALARIDATLLGGANLVITATGTQATGEAGATISIGRIIVTSAVATSQILIQSAGGVQAEIDVWRIEVNGALAAITNTTRGRGDRAGDIVAIDAGAIDRVTIQGNLGLTETSGIGPRLIGPFIGIGGSDSGGIGGPIPVSAVAIDRGVIGGSGNDWDGTNIFVPIQVTNYIPANTLEDVGSPVDPFLNGLIVRSGDLIDVRTGAAMGDVIVAAGDILNAIANSDNLRPFGAFEGIIGSIYANSINLIDIGDGLRGTGPSPFAAAGIFANNEILTVSAERVRSARIEGVILAADFDDAPTTMLGLNTPNPITVPAFSGIGTVRVNSGFVFGAFIQSVRLDDWWQSARVRDVNYITGNVGNVLLTGTDLVRSEIQGEIVGNITITGGVYDSTTINAIENVAAVIADAYRNSTLLGQPAEVHANSITSSRNIGSITTTGLVGDIADLTIDVIGTVTGRIAAGNLLRLSIDVDNVINELFATTDVKATSIVTGRIRNMNVGRNLRNTEMLVAGPIDLATVGNEITGLRILSSGPDGRIGTLRATGRIEADISSSGPIVIIESVNSDVTGTLVTTDIDGNVGTLRAGRDLLIDATITGSVTTVSAGRNVGRRSDGDDRALDIQGSLGSLTAGGQIFSDLLVGQDVTGTIANGRAISKPGNDQVGVGDIKVFGRINALNFMGDVNGDIISYSGGIGVITILNGSFRKGNTITALDGSIGRITITGGDLLGDIHTDGDLTLLELLNGADGWKSQIGISRFKSNAASVDTFRNQLPADTIRTGNADGPRISAGHDIGRIFLQSGSIWESTIIAGRTVREITIRNGGFANDQLSSSIQGSFVIAGDRIEAVSASGRSDRVSFAAGVIALGSDNALGGVGSAADTVKEGTIGSIALTGAGNRSVRITAGLTAGADGVYNTSDDKVAPGISGIGSVNVRSAQASSVWADGPIGSVAGGSGLQVKRNGRLLGPSEPGLLQNSRPAGSIQLAQGVARIVTTTFNQKASITFTGPGAAYWHAATNRVILINTTGESSLVVFGRKNNRNNSGAALRDFKVVSSNNSQLGSLSINAYLRQASTVFIDGGIGTLNLGRTDVSGVIGSGGDVSTFRATRLDQGNFRARAVNSFNVTNVFAGGRVNFLDLGTITVANGFSGSVSSAHDIDTANLGVVNGGRLRAGGDIGAVNLTRSLNGLVSARDTIGPVTVAGNFDSSAVYAGVDLGADANFGGSGLDADLVSNGVITRVTIAGTFPKSDVSAGVYRGVDGFLGTADDVAADGRSTIGPIVIGGRSVGSSINSQQYRVISTGSVGLVTADGSTLSEQGNFAVRQLGALPKPVAVTDIDVFEDSRVYRAEFSFNQPIDASTFAAALSIAEVRNSGATLVGLAQGLDYTVRYNSATNTATVTFSRNVTDRSLPQQPGIPGPGLFRFVLSGAIFRGASQGVMLDGNGDGTTGDDFSMDAVVGDAGDKITAGSTTLPNGSVVDFYGATDLNLLMDSNYASDNNPDPNRAVNIRGTIGDHPDANSNGFRAGGDVDLYRVNLRAGQVLILGQIGGNARNALRAVFDSTGARVDGGGAAFTVLPAATPTDLQATPEGQFLVRTTGTYYIAVAASLEGVNVSDTANVPNNDPVGGAIGSYNFDITIFDDGNTGFSGDTDAGDGSLVINAPVPLTFAGPDLIFGNTDDIAAFTTGRFTFTLNRGPDGIPNTQDDVVSGSDGGEIVSTRRIGPDRLWNTADDELRSTVNSAIGLVGGIGVPSQITPDADVYRLNGGQPILPGTRVRISFRLTESAGNIGLSPVRDALTTFTSLDSSLNGDVQIAVFEMPSGTGFSDARLLASPSEFSPIGGQPQSITTDGVNSYGYDAEGDFFMELVLPGSQSNTSINVPAAYAVYVQGAIRSDYTLEVLTQGTGSIQRSRQNVLIETRGGIIDWLEAGGVETKLDAFTSGVLGFAGQINGVDVDDYIIDAVLGNLNDLFISANVDISVSNDAATFEGQDFSTVFLAGNTEPNAFFNDGTFGASEHVDMLNIDKNDQAVVFVPSLAQLGNDPSQAGVDNLVRALTAAVGRRIGELLGLRMTDADLPGTAVAIMSSSSVTNNPGPAGSYVFPNVNSVLSGQFDTATDTNFYLGVQNSLALIQRIIRPRA